MKQPTPAEALGHVLQLADEYAATLCCHAKREALNAIAVVRQETRESLHRELQHSQTPQP